MNNSPMDQEIQTKLNNFFSPCIDLRRSKSNKISPDRVADFSIWRQFTHEAGLRGSLYVEEKYYDKVLRVAGKYGYSLSLEC